MNSKLKQIKKYFYLHETADRHHVDVCLLLSLPVCLHVYASVSFNIFFSLFVQVIKIYQTYMSFGQHCKRKRCPKIAPKLHNLRFETKRNETNKNEFINCSNC